MWPIDLIGTLLLLLLVARVGRDLDATKVAATEAASSAMVPRRGFLFAALTLLLLDAVLAALVAFGDADLGPWAQSSYRMLGLVTASAQIAVAALAWALRCLAVPKPGRSPAIEAMVVLMFLTTFGIAGCYGLLFGGVLFGR